MQLKAASMDKKMFLMTNLEVQIYFFFSLFPKDTSLNTNLATARDRSDEFLIDGNKRSEALGAVCEDPRCVQHPE